MASKKLTILRYELIDNICRTINESHLPGFVVVECLERILSNARTIADDEYRRDLQEYESVKANEPDEGGIEDADT